MKIAFVSGSLPPIKCGVGFYSYNLLRHLADDIYVDVYTSASVDSVENAATHKVSTWRVFGVWKLSKKILSRNPQCIHIQYPAVGYGRQLGINLLPLFLKIRDRHISVVLTLHEYHGSGFLGKSRNLLTCLFCNQICVSNQYDIHSLPKFIRHKTIVVPIGSNISRANRDQSFYEKLISKSHIRESIKPIVFFGFAFPSKSLEILIEAATKYQFPVLILTELTDSEYHAHLKELISQANQNKKLVYSTGYLSDNEVSQVLQESEVFVLPQTVPLTGKSGTAIAALQHSLAIIAKKAPDPEMNLPYVGDKNAILLEDMNIDTLGSAINALQNNQSLLEQLQLEAQKLSLQFEWQNIADTYKRLYEGARGE